MSDFTKDIRRCIVTASLIAVNIIVFLLVDFTGGTQDTAHMVRCGAAYTPLIMDEGEWYRLITSMFLHFGIQHLLNNMVVLAVLGERLELLMNRAAYILLYFIAGIGGNLLSMVLEMRSGRYAVSAGASGAVFGMMGAILYILLRNRGRILDLSLKRMMIMAALSIYLGMADSGVNNAAHLGGLLCGFLGAVFLYHPGKKAFMQKGGQKDG